MTLSHPPGHGSRRRTRLYVAAALGLGALGAASSLVEWNALRSDTTSAPHAARAADASPERHTTAGASTLASGEIAVVRLSPPSLDGASIAPQSQSQSQSQSPMIVAASSPTRARARRKTSASASSPASSTTAAVATTRPALMQVDADQLLQLGQETYGMGDIARGIRIMERAKASGAQGALHSLCVVYRMPTAAQGMDYAKEVRNCKGVD